MDWYNLDMNSYQDKEVNALLLRCRDRDEDAFVELLTQYTPLINKLIASFSGGADSYDDMFSEACLALHLATLRYDVNQSKVSFGLYAHVCIQNKLIDMYRRRDSLPDIEDGADVELISDESELLTSIITRETVDAVLRAADRILSDYERIVLALHMQGYKTAMIAKALSRDAKSVDNAKSRIFRRLRSVIDK